MAARAIGSGTISFGLVAIPVKLYVAASSEQVRFNLLHRECNSRIKTQYYCPVDDEVVDRSGLVKGYEYARGQYVTLTDEELKALEAERTNAIEITEFVPLPSIDLVQVERSYYLGPDKGGNKPYQLLGQSMRDKDVVAVGRWATRGKDQLVVIRPYVDGLLLHQMYYANEVRDFSQIDTGATVKVSEKEEKLAKRLIDQLSTEQFEPEQYADTYSQRVRELVEQKAAGEEITVTPEAPKAQIIDLFEALKQSVSESEEQKQQGKGPLKPPKKAAEGKAGGKGVKKARSGKSSKKASSS